MDLIENLDTFKLIVEKAPAHIIVTDVNGKILYANEEVEKITGYSKKECIGKNPNLWGGQMSKKFYKNFWQHIKNGETFEGKIINKNKNGKKYIANIKVTPILGANKTEILGFIGTEQNLSIISNLELSDFDIK